MIKRFWFYSVSKSRHGEREGRVIIVSFRCPLCGEEYQMKQIPQEYKTVRCGKCGQVFSIADLPSGAMAKQMGNPAAPVGSPAEAQGRTEEENAPRPTVQNPDDISREMAQRYFSDIPGGPSESAGEAEKAWASEDDVPEEVKRQQRE